MLARLLRLRRVAAPSLIGIALLSGCAGRVSMLPNADKHLRKTPAQFAADAATRHPFKAELPGGGEAIGRAQVGYQIDQLEVANLSDEDWNDIEIWVNREYVVYIPRIPAGNQRVTTINFQMLYNGRGVHFPTDNAKAARMIQSIEMVRDGKIYSLPFRMAD